MDKDLLDAAMLRASEIAILFSHNRPNGKQWHSALNSIGTYAENIARGQDTPTIVIDNWMNS